MKSMIVYHRDGTKTYKINDLEVSQGEFDKIVSAKDWIGGPATAFHSPGAWPMLSDAAGCHPKQVIESMEVAAKLGVPTEFTPQGQAVFTSQSHRKAFLKVSGLRDNSASYGDV